MRTTHGTRPATVHCPFHGPSTLEKSRVQSFSIWIYCVAFSHSHKSQRSFVIFLFSLFVHLLSVSFESVHRQTILSQFQRFIVSYQFHTYNLLKSVKSVTHILIQFVYEFTLSQYYNRYGFGSICLGKEKQRKTNLSFSNYIVRVCRFGFGSWRRSLISICPCEPCWVCPCVETLENRNSDNRL